MSIQAIKPGWWQKPLDGQEKIWLSIAFVWCLAITIIMPWWHVVGDHNMSGEYHKITGGDFSMLTDQFIEKYQVGMDEGIPVVVPPANSDIFLRGAQWEWDPVLKLKAGSTYRLHLSSIDVNHGVSIQPVNMNFQAVPGYDSILTITPTTKGEYRIICNEFCGAGHHAMIGKLIVE